MHFSRNRRNIFEYERRSEWAFRKAHIFCLLFSLFFPLKCNFFRISAETAQCSIRNTPSLFAVSRLLIGPKAFGFDALRFRRYAFPSSAKLSNRTAPTTFCRDFLHIRDGFPNCPSVRINNIPDIRRPE